MTKFVSLRQVPSNGALPRTIYIPGMYVDFDCTGIDTDTLDENPEYLEFECEMGGYRNRCNTELGGPEPEFYLKWTEFPWLDGFNIFVGQTLTQVKQGLKYGTRGLLSMEIHTLNELRTGTLYDWAPVMEFIANYGDRYRLTDKGLFALTPLTCS